MSTIVPYKIMLVDDSSTIRSILKKILQDVDIVEVIGEAENGRIAVSRVAELKPDIILLDIEMPEMDGITALPYLLVASPTSQIIMVSTLTDKNAEISITAMSRGAADYLQKPEAGIDREEFKADLVRKIKALGYASRERNLKTSFLAKPQPSNVQASEIISAIAETQSEFKAEQPINTSISVIQPTKIFKAEAIAMASSTGGPQALQILFGGLKDKLPDLPIFITQHMPPTFTKFLANSLATANSIDCHEATDGMEVIAGKIYVAPGDYHMLVKKEGMKRVIKLDKGEPENFCRPAADPMLRSLVENYGSGLLTVVLTGMGQDGMFGAKLASQNGGMVIAQDKATSVVWGMPGAVCEAGISNGIYPIEKMAARILEICAGKAMV